MTHLDEMQNAPRIGTYNKQKNQIAKVPKMIYIPALNDTFL